MSTPIIDRSAFVTKRTRAVVKRMLTSLGETDLLRSLELKLSEVALVGNHLPDFAAALDEVLDSNLSEQVVFAAVVLLCGLKNHDLPNPHADTSLRAAEAIRLALTSKDSLVIASAILFLRYEELVNGFTNEVAAHLGSSDFDIAVIAAGSLISCNDQRLRGQAYEQLLIFRRSDIAHVRAYAFASLLNIGVGIQHIVHEIASTFHTFTPEVRYFIMHVVGRAGRKPVELFSLASRVALNTSEPAALRGAAMRAVVRLHNDRDEAVRVLASAFSTSGDDCELLLAVCEALSALGEGKLMLNRLSSLISNDSDEVRATAARCASIIGDASRNLISVLAEQFNIETNTSVMEMQAAALAALGNDAIPCLTAVIDGDNLLRTDVAFRAICATSKDGAKTLAQMLRDRGDSRSGLLIASTLMCLGRRSLPAVPILADILDETDNEELAFVLLLIIAACGTSATAAIPTLVRLVAERDADEFPAAGFAIVPLLLMRADAIEVVKNSIITSKGLSRIRLQKALGAMTPMFHSSSSDLERLNDDDLLETFVAIGSLIERQPMSYRAIARAIRTSHLPDSLKKDIPRISKEDDKPIRRPLADLRRALRLEKPITRSSAARGGQELTDVGRNLLHRVRQYLAVKRIRAGNFDK